jgi:hypothetical protein
MTQELSLTGHSVPGSASWRIPLAVQLLPGVLLAAGCFVLPPSPRLLVLRGRIDEASQALSRLRLRKPSEIQNDPLLKVNCLLQPRLMHRNSRFFQIELLEMRVETELIMRTNPVSSKSGLLAEVASWRSLFGTALRPRTMIAVMMMFFQRKHVLHIFLLRTDLSQNGVESMLYSTMALLLFRV